MNHFILFFKIISLAPMVLICFNLFAQEVQKNEPILYAKIDIPAEFVTHSDGLTYGGDLRIGDLTQNGKADFLVYRGAKGDKNGATKPCFMGAFDDKGNVLWKIGEGGIQPYRPGPAAIHDIDNDGQTEVICFFYADTIDAYPFSLEGVSIQIRDGSTGKIEREVPPGFLSQYQGEGPNWVHQRILIANFRGSTTPQDFVVKLGKDLIAFDNQLNLIWSYHNENDEYQNCPAYIPSVGDIDGDGKDEVNGGYYLLDDDGSIMWEKMLGKNMDAVAITEWEDGKMRAFGSGYGHIMDENGNIILKLGEEIVPHGQEIQIADFTLQFPGKEMVLRHNGHHPDAILVGNDGNVLNEFKLNESPNNTGMTAVYWNGRNEPALLFNGGVLWNGWGEQFAVLPNLPAEVGDKKMGWYHCIPADVCGDEREEVITYNPWDKYLFIYTPFPLDQAKYNQYNPEPRQYNVRLMD